MADPKDASATSGNGHDNSLPIEDVETEYVVDEIHEERHSTDNGHEETPVIEHKKEEDGD